MSALAGGGELTALRMVPAAALLVMVAVGLTGCGGHPGGVPSSGAATSGAASDSAGAGASQDLQSVQRTLDDIDRDIAGDPR